MYQRKNLSLHASAIEIKNHSFLFMGLSGSGKSYLVSEMLNYGKFLSEDISRISFKNSVSYVHPSHCLLKLEDSKKNQKKFLKYNSNLSFDKRNRASYSVDEKYLSRKPIQIKACFLLNFSDHFSIQKLDEKKSFALMLQSSFKSNPLFSSKENDIYIDNLISKMISDVDFYLVNRKKNSNNIKLIKDYITKEV